MKADVYSFAIMLWEILNGRTPYGYVKGRSHLIHQIVEENVRPTIDESWPSSIQGLLERSFYSEIGKRPVSPCLIEMHVMKKFSHSSTSSV
jgi:hypothetical protein